MRTIFRSYLKLGSLNLLMADLRKRRHCHQAAEPEDRVKDRRRHTIYPGVARRICCAIASTSAKWLSRARSSRASKLPFSTGTYSMPSRARLNEHQQP